MNYFMLVKSKVWLNVFFSCTNKNQIKCGVYIDFGKTKLLYLYSTLLTIMNQQQNN